jgi:WD40 repeat protein/uncharacterized caspase-like protein
MKTIFCLVFLLVATWLPAQAPRLVVPIGHTGSVSSVGFSPDGKYILTGSWDKTAILWDITGKEIQSFIGHSAEVTSVAFSPDGKMVLTGSRDYTAKLWDLKGHETQTFLSDRASVIECVTFSPDSKMVLTGSMDKTAHLTDLEGNIIQTFSGHAGGIKSVAFSPDGNKVLTGSMDGTAKLWDLNGNEIQTFSAHAGGIKSVAFSPDGNTILTGSWDKTAKLWNLNGREILTFSGHVDYIESVAFSPDGKNILTGSQDNTAKLWDLKGREIQTFSGHKMWVFSVVFSPDGNRLLTGSEDYTAKLWDLTGQEIRTFSGHGSVVNSITFSPDGNKLLIGSMDGTARLWTLAKSGTQTFSGHEKSITSVAFSPDGSRVLTGSEDFTAKLWDLTGRETQTFSGHMNYIESVAFSPDGKKVLTGSLDGTAKLWDLNGRKIHNFFAHSNGVKSVNFSPDGKYVLTDGNDQTAKLWDLAGRELQTFSDHLNNISVVAFSPDGTKVLTGSYDKTAKLWDVSGRQIQSFYGHAAFVSSVAFSPDGKQVLTGSWDHTAKLWDVSGREIQSFSGHASHVSSVAFSPDGKHILTGSFDNTTKLWDTKSGKELAALINIDSADWVVTTPSGLFDASPGAMKLMHYVQGLEVIELEQLKKRYWEPGLLAQIMSGKPLRDVNTFDALPLYPKIEATITGDRLQVKLTKRSGGMGPLSLFINGKEVAENINPGKKTALDIDLHQFNDFYLDSNSVILRAFNAAGWLKSQAYELLYVPALSKGQGGNNSTPSVPARSVLPHLYAIVIGTSDYNNPGLKLQFPDLDAEAMAQALRAAGNRLFDERVHLQLLSTAPGQTLATKQHIKAAFEAFQAQAKAADILVVYFSGHGLTYGPAENNQFYYLTKDIPDADLRDTLMLKSYTVSSTELTAWVNAIPAQKQVLIFDACNSGSVAKAFEASAAKEFSPTQIRAYDEMKDRTGTFILAGSAADKVSFEASEYGQGLLTYSLLQGMSGSALLDDKRVDVMKLFQFARTRVPDLAKGISQVQTPMMAFPENRKGSRGESFSIGKVDAQTKMPPLKSVKPIFIKPLFIDAEAGEDGLDLVQGLEGYFDEQTSVLSYMPVDKFENGYKISGTYKTSGAVVELSGVLKKGEGKKGFKVSGIKQDVRGLVEKIMAEVWKLVGGW